MIMMFYMFLSGLLVRADGWGTDEPRWKSVANFFNAITCALIFAILTIVYTNDIITGFCAGWAFWIWRAPGFHGWEKWGAMFWRGLWSTSIGFTLLSYVAHGHGLLGLLTLPFSVIYMTIYAGGYKWLPETILGFNRHVWIEHASGLVFGAFILAVING